MTYILLEFLKPKVNFRFNLKKKRGKKTKKSLRYLQLSFTLVKENIEMVYT